MGLDAVSRPISDELALPHFNAVLAIDPDTAADDIAPLLRQGRFFAFVPRDTPAERIAQLSVGGLLPQQSPTPHQGYLVAPKPDTRIEFADLIIRLARGMSDGFAIFREPYLEKCDDSSLVADLRQVGSGLYKLVAGSVLTPEDVADDIRALACRGIS